MAAELTEAEFSKHVNTKFRIQLEGEGLELELVEVKGYLPNPGDQKGMERFSLFFRGPAKPQLQQSIFSLTHDAMGDFELFLVPIQTGADGSRYEAVFNYFKDSEE